MQNHRKIKYFYQFIRVIGALYAAIALIMGTLTAHLPDHYFITGGRAITQRATAIEFYHALALILFSFVQMKGSKLLIIAQSGIALGPFLFCVAVYYFAFSGHHLFNIAPTGGIIMILSWLLLAFSWLFYNPTHNGE